MFDSLASFSRWSGKDRVARKCNVALSAVCLANGISTLLSILSVVVVPVVAASSVDSFALASKSSKLVQLASKNCSSSPSTLLRILWSFSSYFYTSLFVLNTLSLLYS